MVKKYRGLTPAIRRSINMNELNGHLTMKDIRRVLPSPKKEAPDETIKKSLQYLAGLNEICMLNGEFFTKNIPVEAGPPPEFSPEFSKPTMSGGDVSIIGKLLETKMEGNKIIATVEVKNINCG